MWLCAAGFHSTSSHSWFNFLDFMFGCMFIFLTWVLNICFLYLFSFPSILQCITGFSFNVSYLKSIYISNLTYRASHVGKMLPYFRICLTIAINPHVIHYALTLLFPDFYICHSHIYIPRFSCKIIIHSLLVDYFFI